MLLTSLKTTFVEKSAPYLSAQKLNDYWTSIEAIINALKTLPIDQGSWNASGATSTSYKLTSYRVSAPGASELPLAFVIVPTITNGLNATITASWGATAYQIWDMSTNARVTADVIVANRPVQLVFDGTKFWVVGAAAIVHGSAHLTGGADPIPTDTTPVAGSIKPITSGAVYEVEDRVATVENALPTKSDLVDGIVKASQARTNIITRTGSFTAGASDAESLQLMNNTTAATITLPSNLPVGTSISAVRWAVGSVTFAYGSGASGIAADGILSISAAGKGAVAIVVSSGTWWIRCE